MALFSKKTIKALEATQRKVLKAGAKLDELEKKEVKLQKEVRDDLKQIARIGIDKFYESYNPLLYERYGDLYNLFQVTANETEYSITYHYENMRYHPDALKPYLYEWVFLKGYHGGAISGPDHPNPGTPWYKKFSGGQYYLWSRPAEKTNSPYEYIETEAKSYIHNAVQKRTNTIINPARQIVDNLTDSVTKVVKKING